jgi:hypothetical protein
MAKQLIAGLSPRRSGFDSGSVYVGFVVDKVALGQVFLRVLRFSPVNFIPPVSIKMEKQKKPHRFHNLPYSVSGVCYRPFNKKKYSVPL